MYQALIMKLSSTWIKAAVWRQLFRVFYRVVGKCQKCCLSSISDCHVRMHWMCIVYTKTCHILVTSGITDHLNCICRFDSIPCFAVKNIRYVSVLGFISYNQNTLLCCLDFIVDITYNIIQHKKNWPITQIKILTLSYLHSEETTLYKDKIHILLCPVLNFTYQVQVCTLDSYELYGL